MKNGIIVPCYNEADRLKFDEFKTFLNENPNYLICFVNDGSKDETLNQLINFKMSHNNVIIHNLPQNCGKAEAVRQGVSKILEIDSIQNVGFLDADLATGFDDYKRLVSTMKFGNLEMVFGSRKMKGGEEIERSLFRKLASLLVGMMIKVIVGMPIQDTQCGAKVFTQRLARQIFKNPFQSRWLFDVEIFIRVKNIFKNKAMKKIKEIALNNWEEVDGSKITLKDSLKFPVQLFEIGYDYKLKPKILNINYQIRQLTTVVNPAA